MEPVVLRTGEQRTPVGSDVVPPESRHRHAAGVVASRELQREVRHNPTAQAFEFVENEVGLGTGKSNQLVRLPPRESRQTRIVGDDPNEIPRLGNDIDHPTSVAVELRIKQ